MSYNFLTMVGILVFSVCVGNPAKSEQPSASLYQLKIELETHNGKNASLSLYEGHPVIIGMFYTSCEYACPMIIANIKLLLKKFPLEVQKKLRVLMISFDPDRDSPAALLASMKKYHVDGTNWTFSRVAPQQVRLLATSLNQKFKRLDNGDFNHTPMLTLLDDHGRIIGQRDQTKSYEELVNLYQDQSIPKGIQ